MTKTLYTLERKKKPKKTVDSKYDKRTFAR